MTRPNTARVDWLYNYTLADGTQQQFYARHSGPTNDHVVAFLDGLHGRHWNRDSLTAVGISWNAQLQDHIPIYEIQPPESRLQRMWVNQPSSLQPHHDLHGTNVLAMPESARTMRVYFLSGDVISQNMTTLALSPGWHTGPRSTDLFGDGIQRPTP